jgi:hypothetical protein
MFTERNKQLVRQYYEEVVNGAKLDELPQFISEFTAVNLDKVHGGRIVEHDGAANMLEPLLKIGAVQVVSDD